MEIPVLDRSSVVLGQRIATGAGGIIFEGRMKTDEGWKEVAVKEVSVPVAGEEYKAELTSVATTAYLAGTNTHVCDVYGISWGEKDCWLIMEHCSGSIFDVVKEAEQESGKPGLPAIDVVMLGLMMTDALKAVHKTSGKFHGDVRPHNILLAPAPAGHTAPRPIGVRLIDFAFTSHLPGRLVSAAHGYVAPECTKGKDHSPASDVYSLGGSLLFALTSSKPYGDADPTKLSQLMFVDKEPMTVPEDVSPPELAELLKSMTKLAPEERPSVEDVDLSLSQLYETLRQEGDAPKFLGEE